MIPAPVGRLAYRFAYLGLRIFSLVVRPRTRGVKCIVCAGDEVLLVRHSYGKKDWDMPGGFARRGEAFEDAARRELGEELNVPEPTALSLLGEFRRDHLGRHETLGVVRAELPERRAEVRGFELLELAWFRRDALPGRRAEVVDETLELEAGLSAPGRG